MTWGFAILVNYSTLIFLTVLHLVMSLIFYRTYIHSSVAPLNLKIFALFGYWALIGLGSGLWFFYLGDGLIIDLEYFWYK